MQVKPPDGDRRGDGKSDPPPTWGRILDGAGNAIGHPIEIALVQDERDAGQRWRHRRRGFASRSLQVLWLSRPSNLRRSQFSPWLCSPVCGAALVLFLLGVHAVFLLAFVPVTQTRDRDRSRVRHLRVRITNPREITRPRFNVQVIEQSIIAILRLDLRHSRSRDRRYHQKQSPRLGRPARRQS